MGRLLQFFAFLLLFRYVLRGVASWLTDGGAASRRMEGRPGGGQPVYRGQMVRDPVCGVFLLPERALEDHQGDQTLHFCSENCRQAYRAQEVTVRP
jgi:YHS domain-containing protein